MVHLRPSISALERGGRPPWNSAEADSDGRIELLHQACKIAQAVGARSSLQALVLGQDIDKPLTDVVAVAKEDLAAPAAELRGHVANR